jgi:hypothetical protein
LTVAATAIQSSGEGVIDNTVDTRRPRSQQARRIGQIGERQALRWAAVVAATGGLIAAIVKVVHYLYQHLDA